MKVPYSSIVRCLDLGRLPGQRLDVNEIEKGLWQLGVEVDAVTTLSLPWKGVLIAAVHSVGPHPNAGRLRLVEVSDSVTTHQVVCGASNVRPNMKVAFAPPGAQLGDLAIEARTLRGVLSEGMICGADELGLSKIREGILSLPQGCPEGAPLSSLFEDTLFEISLTPNLSHAQGVLGLTRDLAAVLNLPWRDPVWTEDLLWGVAQRPECIQTQGLEDVYYQCCALRAPTRVSPFWLQRCLFAHGLSSSYFSVDVTQWVMLQTGQPMHAFDLETLKSQKVILRFARQGETLVTINDREQLLSQEDLLVCDGEEQPIALAGVMGGKETAVAGKTKSILLESAAFPSSSIRSTATRLDLFTDAAQRYMRGFSSVRYAMQYALQLLVDSPEEQIDPPSLLSGSTADTLPPLLWWDAVGERPQSPEVWFSLADAKRYFGKNMPQGGTWSLEDIKRRFLSYGHSVMQEKGDLLKVRPFHLRHDLNGPEDYVEELARHIGYDKMHIEPCLYSPSSYPTEPLYSLERKVRQLMLAEGMHEWVNSSLISLPWSAFDPTTVLVPHLQPRWALRTTLLFGMLETLQRSAKEVASVPLSFEVGKVYALDDSPGSSPYREITRLGCIGEAPFELKGVLESLLQGIYVSSPHMEDIETPKPYFLQESKITLAPPREEGVGIGHMGSLRPSFLRKKGFSITTEVWFFEVDLQSLLPWVPHRHSIKMPNKYPATSRDWTFPVSSLLPFSSVESLCRSACEEFRSPYGVECRFIATYPINEEMNHLTMRFVYRKEDDTITAHEANSMHEVVERQVQGALRALEETP